MKYILFVLLVVAIVMLLILLTAFVCYRIVFYAEKKKELKPDEIDLPTG